MGRNVFNATYSEALSLLIADKDNEKADGACTGGYDNDGSTGVEIYDNGISLGIALSNARHSEPEANLWWGETEDRQCFFVIARTEHEACEKVRSWADKAE